MIATILLSVILSADSSVAPAPADSANARAAVVDSTRANAAASIPVVVTLPEVRVERERVLSEARRRLPTAFVTDLSAGTSNRALETVSDVLAQAAGVHVDQYGGLGAYSTVSLRGAPPGQVSVYLDGAPLTSAAHGVVNLADLPAGAIERVEIYRGLSPLALGPATPGGAINLVTASVARIREARVIAGSYGTWEGRASAGGARGNLSGFLHGGIQTTRGDFDHLSDNGTPFNLNDDFVAPRQNNRFDAATALGTLRWRARHDLSAMLREDFFRKAQGLPGMGSVPALNSRLSFLRSITQMEIARDAGRATPETKLSVSLERQRSQFRDNGGPYGLGELRLGPHDSDDRFGSEHLTLEALTPQLPLGASLSGSASAGLDRADLVDPGDGYPDPPQSRRVLTGASLTADWRPMGEWLTLHAAKRWDRIEDHLRSTGVAGLAVTSDATRELDSPQLGVRVIAPYGTEVRANWSRAVRPPDFLELFGNQGSVTGNPKLKPETGENRDFGASWSHTLGVHADATIEWAHFESDASDLILYWTNSPNTTHADNVTSARIRGEELSVRLRPWAPLALAGAFTWQSAIDEGPFKAWHGKRLPQRPGRQAWTRADLTRGGARLSAEIQYIGDNYLDRYNRYRVTSRTLAGASLSAPFLAGTRGVVEAKNLGDNRISDVGGFPLPGRSVFVSMEWRLGPAGSARP
ncbi:MAG: TonB-dependent receptor [Candidatus Eisenbacteria bacterium]|nr:TonB-dependent receptor [Candidatus Eisenbacteria bacterium]